MRELSFGHAPADTQPWVRDAIQEIQLASYEDVQAVLESFTVTNFTETRTLDAGTATTTQIANFLATLIDDIQKQGINEV